MMHSLKEICIKIKVNQENMHLSPRITREQKTAIKPGLQFLKRTKPKFNQLLVMSLTVN